MNWPLIIRRICEAYFKTPAEIEDMTMDQIAILGIDKNILQRAGALVEGSPEKLFAMGVLPKRPYPGGLSLAMRIKLGVEDSQGGRKAKRARRAARRRELEEMREQGT